MKHAEHARPVPVRRRHAAQGKLDAGEDRLLPAAGEALAPSPPSARRAMRGWPRRRGSRSAGASSASVRAWQWTASTSCSISSRAASLEAPASPPAAFSTRSTSFTASSRSSRCSSRRCRSAANGAGSASRLVKTSRVSPAALSRRAEREDGVQLVARVLGEGRRRFLRQEGRQEDALHVVHHQQRRLLGQRPLDRQDGLLQVVERGDGVIRPHKLAAEGIEHRGGVAVRLDRDERGAAHLLRADQPAGELGGERGLAFAALAAHHGVAGPLTPAPLPAAAGRGRGGAAGAPAAPGCGR